MTFLKHSVAMTVRKLVGVLGPRAREVAKALG